MLWPFIERIPGGILTLTDYNYDDFIEKELPTIYEYRHAMLKDRAVAKLTTEPEVYKNFNNHLRKNLINGNK